MINFHLVHLVLVKRKSLKLKYFVPFKSKRKKVLQQFPEKELNQYDNSTRKPFNTFFFLGTFCSELFASHFLPPLGISETS